MKKYLNCACKMIKHHSSVKEAILIEDLFSKNQTYFHYQDLEEIEQIVKNNQVDIFDINNLYV